MLKRTQFNNMFKAGNSSTKRIEIDPEDIRPTPEAVARYFGGPKYQMTSETHQRVYQGIQQALGMVDPIICYRAIPMDKFEEECGIVLTEDVYKEILPDSTDGHAPIFRCLCSQPGQCP